LGQFGLGLFILVSLYAFSDYLCNYYSLSVPPAIIGIFALFVCFIVMSCVPKAIYAAGQPLLKHMSLFFLPAIVAIVNYTDVIKAFPIALALAVIVTTLISLALTGLLAQWLMTSLLPSLNYQENAPDKKHDAND